jgi:predicted nucleic acid-binding protein
MGQAASFADGQIASIAAVLDLRLVTANRRDFAPFEGVRIEDWWG